MLGEVFKSKSVTFPYRTSDANPCRTRYDFQFYARGFIGCNYVSQFLKPVEVIAQLFHSGGRYFLRTAYWLGQYLILDRDLQALPGRRRAEIDFPVLQQFCLNVTHSNCLVSCGFYFDQPALAAFIYRNLIVRTSTSTTDGETFILQKFLYQPLHLLS